MFPCLAHAPLAAAISAAPCSSPPFSALLLTLLRRLAGKSDVERICKKVFEDLADKNTGLLDANSLHVATLMVYK